MIRRSAILSRSRVARASCPCVPRASRPWASVRRGTTLLELIVALAILGGLVVMISTVYAQTIRTRSLVLGRLDVADRARAVMSLVVSDLENMHTYDSRAYLLCEVSSWRAQRATGRTTRQTQEMSAMRVAFPTGTPIRVSEEQRERPGLIEVAYLVGESPTSFGQYRLYRREMPIETDPNQTVIRTTDQGLTLLSDGVENFYMEFLSADAIENTPAGTLPAFEDSWEPGFGPDSLPVVIRVTLTMGDPEGEAPSITLRRTVRLPTRDVAAATLQADLEKSLGMGEEDE